MASRKCHACCAPGRPGRTETAVRPPLAHPFGRRGSDTPAVPERPGRIYIETAVRDHPLRTPYGVEK
eukprot:5620606-Pyramimonas_sp.AAC.1